MNKIITFGFLPINSDTLRESSLKKGQKLQESNHVYGVIETVDNVNQRISITAKVIPQTNVLKATYSINILVDISVYYQK